ncbi:DUF1654 domain-containing protein [Pseudomonas aeruginosa]|uniref:DUF1654 domain-containing protein n=1 Tax=Pseudomonas aeruginosa TaxID=287 RepID=UPI003D2658E5
MAKKQQAYEVTPTDRLGMRVSAMINSPKAQELGKMTIHWLDTDLVGAWDEVMEVLAETDGIDLVFNDDGTVTLRWERQDLEGEGGNEKPHGVRGASVASLLFSAIFVRLVLFDSKCRVQVLLAFLIGDFYFYKTSFFYPEWRENEVRSY